MLQLCLRHDFCNIILKIKYKSYLASSSASPTPPPALVTPANFNNFLSVFIWPDSPQRAGASSFTRFLNHTPHSIGILWTSDQPNTDTPENTQQSQQTDVHALGGIRTHIHGRRAAADLRLRLRGRWDWLMLRTFFFSWRDNPPVCLLLLLSVGLPVANAPDVLQPCGLLYYP